MTCAGCSRRSPEIELTACFSTSSAMPHASAKVIFWSVAYLQPVVRDDDQRVDLVGQIRDAHLGLTHPVRALKLERLGHAADGQNALVVRAICAATGRPRRCP